MHFQTDISAAPEKIWQVLWDDATYPEWTSIFSEGSRAENDWQEGSTVRFLNGEGEGMYSTIEQVSPGRHMAFRHIGMVKEGKDQPVDAAAQAWTGARELYTLSRNGPLITLQVELDTTEGAADYFSRAFPKAPEKIKALSEG